MAGPDFNKTFGLYREYLHQEKSALSSFVTIYRQLYELRDTRLQEINIAPAFFQLVTSSVYSSIIIWTDKLLDERGDRGYFDFLNLIERNLDAFSIEALLSRSQEHPPNEWFIERRRRDPITSLTVMNQREQIRSLKPLSAIRLRRDKLHAHFDKKYFFERHRLQEDAPLMWGDFESVVDVMQEILNTYSAAFDGTSMSREPVNTHDLKYLLDRLQFERERRRKEQ